MAYEVRESSGKLYGYPKGGYQLGFPVVKSNSLALANEFTKDRDSGKRKPPLTPDRNPRGTKGGHVSSNAGLRSAAKARTIVPSI